ncbi:aladin-like [Mya arenaria]|uniref:aladin-like n=1 Tax=Mya arenaria TaxID=6604 RepID=UPI0022E6BDA4|nr:aladin-like [Mya arenaria]XP_052785290.1 aladin-like [Mya arenaria]
MMSSASTFVTFPAPPGPGMVTVEESIGNLRSLPQNQAKLRVQGYPDVQISKDSTRSLTQRENAKSAFLPHNETVSKRVYHAWQDTGLSGSLEEIINSSQDVPNWVCGISQQLLMLTRWTSSLHGSFSPHLALSNDEIVSKFTSIQHWSTSPIKAFDWHPHVVKFAYALQDDSIRVHCGSTELVPTLKHKLQKNIADLKWQPNSSSILAVACQSGVLIWHVEPTSLATRPSSSSVQVLQRSGHTPVTSLSWSPDGRTLLSASPVDTSMLAWSVAMETCTPLWRFGGGGVSLLSWSPDGSKVFAATPSNLFRVWETRHWGCEKWNTSTGFCKAACWSPDGSVVLFSTENQPIIYSLTFAETTDDTSSVIGGSQTAVGCVDLSETELQNEDGNSVKLGGYIQQLAWDPLGERLAVMLEETCDYVAVFRTTQSPVLEITPCGFVRGLDGEKPELIQFQPNFEGGSLLTVVWSSGRIGYIPMRYIPSSSKGVNTQDQPAHSFHSHRFTNGLYSQQNGE